MRPLASSILLIAFTSAVLARAQTPATELILHNFNSAGLGPLVVSGVIRDEVGDLYGTTEAGGASNRGTVYKISPLGLKKILYSFTSGSDGASPASEVIRDSAGNLYGTTVYGGVSAQGTVYKIDSSGQESLLHSFNGGSDGANPYSGLTLDTAGNLYGTTFSSGTSNGGTVYKIDASGQETVLYSFNGGSDGANPYSGVIRDSAGNLYGTTYSGGAWNKGTVYEIDASGQETVLYSFAGESDGANPYSGVIRDRAGNLYGTTRLGAQNNCGVVYKINSSGQDTVLYVFPGEGSAGCSPATGVIRDAVGNLYGTTYSGGASDDGTVYKIDSSGQENVLYSFTGGSSGANPISGVIRDAEGSLYGTTIAGGAMGEGTVYKIDASDQEAVLYSFSRGGSVQGVYPLAGVIRDHAGNLYGTTPDGGFSNQGTVYSIDSLGRETLLHSFTGGTDGAVPYAGVIRDSAGNLYGTTLNGGVPGAEGGFGTVYKIDASGQETVLYSFAGGSDGANPEAEVIRDADGNLYGTTYGGGASAYGTVYKIDSSGQHTVLYSFTGGSDGANPVSGVIRDAEGDLYGTTLNGGVSNQGTAYQISSSGQENVLHSFSGLPDDGATPNAGVIRDAAGNLYGTTTYGGAPGFGTVYKIAPSGQETLLYSFTGYPNDGQNPYGALIRDGAGNLYGTTRIGGLFFSGTVFQLDPTGVETVLYSFQPQNGTDGSFPNAGVTIDGSGQLFGTTGSGGTLSGGTVFKLVPNP